MSDPQAAPENDGQISAEGVDPDLVSEESRPDPEEVTPAEEDEEDIDLSDLP